MERDQEIRYTEIEKTDAYIYDKVEMKVRVEEIYEVVIKDLDGISFIKRAVAPYIKDFSGHANYKRWNQQFDLSNWHFSWLLTEKSRWAELFCAATARSFICWRAERIWGFSGISVWIPHINAEVSEENCLIW